jgi:hypothetical protein
LEEISDETSLQRSGDAHICYTDVPERVEDCKRRLLFGGMSDIRLEVSRGIVRSAIQADYLTPNRPVATVRGFRVYPDRAVHEMTGWQGREKPRLAAESCGFS